MVNYDSFQQALANLQAQFEHYRTLDKDYPQFIQEGMAESVVRRFVGCYECVLETLQRYLSEDLGVTNVPGIPKSIFRLAHENDLLTSVEQWFAYTRARIDATHDYSAEKAQQALPLIGDFIKDAVALRQAMDGTPPSDERRAAEATDGIDITPGQRKIILDLLGQHLPGAEVWVYGSRAKRTSRPQSDLDMVVFAEPEQSMQVFDLREDLEESDLPFRVDLFVWGELPVSFRRNIEKEYVVLTGKPACKRGGERDTETG